MPPASAIRLPWSPFSCAHFNRRIRSNTPFFPFRHRADLFFPFSASLLWRFFFLRLVDGAKIVFFFFRFPLPILLFPITAWVEQGFSFLSPRQPLPPPFFSIQGRLCSFLFSRVRRLGGDFCWRRAGFPSPFHAIFFFLVLIRPFASFAAPQEKVENFPLF